jgi:hypothetical protein
MASATNYEARFEAAKMLCDLFQQRQTQLQNDKVREACISCIETLVHDGFADVQQFAIMAMSLMAEVDQNYKVCYPLLAEVQRSKQRLCVYLV